MRDNKKILLSAEWKNLIMINYEVDPKVLLPYLPAYAISILINFSFTIATAPKNDRKS